MRFFGRNCFFSCHMLPLCFRQRLATKNEWPCWPRVGRLGFCKGAADRNSNSMCVVFVSQGLHVGIVEPHCQMSLKWISKPCNTCLTLATLISAGYTAGCERIICHFFQFHWGSLLMVIRSHNRRRTDVMQSMTLFGQIFSCLWNEISDSFKFLIVGNSSCFLWILWLLFPTIKQTQQGCH